MTIDKLVKAGILTISGIKGAVQRGEILPQGVDLPYFPGVNPR